MSRAAKINPSLFRRMKKKAALSPSQYRVSCVALDSSGDILGFTTNKFRKDNVEPFYGSGLHAEALACAKFGPMDLKTLIIMRVGNAGDLLPIDPCPQCQKMAAKMGVKIFSAMPGHGPKQIDISRQHQHR